MKPSRLKTLPYLLLVLLLLALASAQEAPPEPIVRDLLEHPVQDEILYFLIPDRFFDGNPENNCGDYQGPCLPNASREEVLTHGYLPSDKGYYHGGDIAGLIQQLDYLEEMGVTALWVGPIFENKPVQEDATNLYGHSSGYHGYWITDFMRVDPHLGTNEEFVALVEAAHARDIKVFIDIITNHTADVIQYEEGEYSYRSKAQYPYLDVHGEPFDDADYAYYGQEDYAFPEMDIHGFPYTPFVPEEEEGIKNPAWLNDLTLYHNRGNTTFTGENSLYGDFFGLDDLFTERKEVVEGMIEIYRYWIEEFNVDGFRIDTTKHVNIEFWQAFGPAILEAAREAGIDHFFAFGEVYDERQPFLSYFWTTGELQSTIDFAFQGAARNFASQSLATDGLRDLFALDDYYTHAGGNANVMPTFVGNHDMGRIGFFLQEDQPDASDEELLKRSALAHALMFFARGQPVIYYGDEQGFTGDGGDKDARQNMFPSQVPSYNDDNLIGTEATTAEDNFDPTHPLYRTFRDYARIYATHPALRRGAQIHRYSSDQAGIYAFSRVDRDERVEFIVALNNDPVTTHTAAVPTYYGEGSVFERVLGEDETTQDLTTGAGGQLELTVPPLSTVIYRAGTAFPASETAPEIGIASPQDNQSVTLGINIWDGHEAVERLEIAADVNAETYVEVSFAVSVNGGDYQYIGTDASPPYRVFYDVTGLPEAASLSFMASASNPGSQVSTATVSGVTVSIEEATPATTGYPYAVIHYHRPDGDYGSLEAGDYWGVHTWGDALAPDQGQDLWEEPIPFVGESDFGRFAYFRLADSSAPFNFIIHTPGGDEVPETREPGGDRSFTPDEHPEVWIVQGDETIFTSQAEAQGFITVHYHREDTDDGNVTLDATINGEPLATDVQPSGSDAYGVVFTLSQADYENLDFSRPLSLTVNIDGTADVTGVTFTPAEGMASVYLQQGDPTAYRSQAAAENVVILHYRRHDGDYGDYTSPDFNDFWGVHVWTGAANPTEWQEPIRASGQDTFGVFFRIPLEPDAEELAYILHRGDDKDPGPDQFLDLAAHGHEVWQESGADPEYPYVLPVSREQAAYQPAGE